MQKREINSAVCEDELERTEEETFGPILRYCPNICLRTLRKTTKLIRMLGPQVRKQSWALPNTKLKCWSLACCILFETVSFLLIQPDSDHEHLSCPPQLVSVKFYYVRLTNFEGFESEFLLIEIWS